MRYLVTAQYDKQNTKRY